MSRILKISLFGLVIVSLFALAYIHFSPFAQQVNETTLTLKNEIQKTAPLILKKGEPVSNLTTNGILTFTNSARKDNGDLPALTLNDNLSLVARLRLKDMFTKQYFEHYSPQGIGAAEVAKQEGYYYIVIGENIALGNFKDDQTLVKAWMDSPGHRANILNDRYTEIGIAAGKGIFQGTSTWIAVQVFGRPASLCPRIEDGLKNRIDLYENSLTDLKNQASFMAGALRTASTETAAERDAYNAKVADYNAVVAKINSTVALLKDLISAYNAQVRAFNACLKE